MAAPRLLQRRQRPQASMARVQLEALHNALQAQRVDVGHQPGQV
ncbi:hypothetical protein [Azohydromonas lata]|uniref:Uncharacterized protein n=1 Tax=Azohydromonas lata TaxID=45677 RepID=A0ABU5IRT2_9BURK|nr:hypothetical protein [Azohydromonas lata]MDZ5461602.1 hypothetical protein [Azohydromonas lata]